jgi:hypothetical protein
MRTTLVLPDKLIHEAMKVTHSRTKTSVIIHALQGLIQSSKIAKIKEYHGKLRLHIDLNALRQR